MVRKPKVLMVGADMASKGGVASVIRMYEQAGLFDRVMFLASYSDGRALRKILFYLGFLLRYILLYLTRPSVQIVHIHTSSYGSFFRKSIVVLLAKLFGKKSIIHMHGAGFNVFYNKMPAPIRWYIRNVLNCCVVLIALSRQWKDDLCKIAAHPDIRVIYNPTILREPLFQRSGPSHAEESVNFLFMGRLGQRKGVYDIVESVRQVQANNVRIKLYGDGEVDSIQTLVSKSGLGDKVAVCGWIDGDQKDETFRQANVLLLPSYHEGLPISILEQTLVVSLRPCKMVLMAT
jgi:glycosyltransferase involved in cell wall biosynthesis